MFSETASVALTDSDGDGLLDGWETSNRLDAPNAGGPDGADGDPDGDGRTSHQEYLSCTDPADAASVPTAPTVSALNYPGDGNDTNVLQPWLSVSNASDVDCQEVRYVFELYADEQLTTLVDATAAGGMAKATTPLPGSPAAPTILVVSAPPDGSEVTLHRPTLEVVNAADADGEPLT